MVARKKACFPKLRIGSTVFSTKGEYAFKRAFKVIAQVDDLVWLRQAEDSMQWEHERADFIETSANLTRTDLRKNPTPPPRNCPICGKSARVFGDGSFHVGCRTRNCIGLAVMQDTVEEAVAVWNRFHLRKTPRSASKTLANPPRCPFCRCDGWRLRRDVGDKFYCVCDDCGSEGPYKLTAIQAEMFLRRLPSKGR